MGSVKRIDLKRNHWSDHRGWGVNPIDAAGLAGKPVYHFHTVSMKPGAVRGNHYHTDATEWLFVCGGPAKVVWRSDQTGPCHEVLVKKEEPALFEIPPHIEHAVMNTSQVEIFLLSFSNAPDRDTTQSPSLF